MMKYLIVLIVGLSSTIVGAGQDFVAPKSTLNGIELLLAAASANEQTPQKDTNKSSVIAHLIGRGSQIVQEQEISKKRLRQQGTENTAEAPRAKKHKEALVANGYALCQIDKQQKLANITESLKKTLFHAVESGNTALVKHLIDKNINLTLLNQDKSALLHVAAEKCQSDIVKLLLEAKADKDVRDVFNATPLHRAVYCPGKKLCKHIDIVKLLLEAKADKDAKDQFDNTPLQWAASKGNVIAVKLLLQAGANKDNKNKNQETALHIAATKGHSEIIKQLLAIAKV